MSTNDQRMQQPTIINLSDLLREVRDGMIQVPRFQRPFVWGDERRIDLLRSIRDGVPIGSLLVWKTSKHQLACFDRIAGLRVPPPTPGHEVKYLLDGHQRVTTLISAFVPSPAGEIDDDHPAPLGFDLKANDFVVLPNEPTRTGNTPPSLVLPMPWFLDSKGLRKYFRELDRVGPSTLRVTPEEMEELFNRAEMVLYSVSWLSVPMIPLVTEDLTLATKTFYRVNSMGQRMTEFHMISALTWGAKVNEEDTPLDLAQSLEQAWERVTLPERWEPTDEQQTLTVIKGMLGMELARSPVETLVSRIKERPQLGAEAVALLARAMHLASTLIGTPVSLPYQMQLTITAIALHELPEGVTPDPELLRRWWGLTTVWGSFASAASHRVRAALIYLKDALRGELRPWPDSLLRTVEPQPLPNLELRNARARYFLDGYAQGCGQLQRLHQYDSRALLSLSREHGPRPGNRLLWPTDQRIALEEALTARDEERLRGHFIDAECLDRWEAKDVLGFITHRESLMNAREAEWFRSLRPEDFIAGRP